MSEAKVAPHLEHLSAALTDFRIMYRIKNIFVQLNGMPFELHDSFAEKQTKLSAEFGVTLRDYQARTLTWLLNLEKNVDSRVMYYIDRNDVKEKETLTDFRIRTIKYGPNGPFYSQRLSLLTFQDEDFSEAMLAKCAHDRIVCNGIKNVCIP